MSEKKKRVIMTKRVLMTIVGVLTTGACVGLFNFSVFGMDPFQVFVHGVCGRTVGLEHFGTFYAVLNLIMLIGIFFLDKKKLGLGTIINIFLLGYVVQFSSWAMDRLIPHPGLLVRILALATGIIVMCLAVSLYFTADLGVSTYDAVALIMNEKTHWKFRYCRIGSDLVCTTIGFALGAVAGVGTLVTALFMGPIIDFFSRTVARPFLYGREGSGSEVVEKS